jgi:hypothetical protein
VAQQFPSDDVPQPESSAAAQPGAVGPGPRHSGHAFRSIVLGAVSGIAVLALIGCVVLIGGKTITIGSSSRVPSGAASASTSPAANPSSTAKVITKVITRWRTRASANSVMQQVTVPDPSGSGTMDEGWRARIPCIYVPSAAELLLGDAGAAAGAVNETCTLTIIQLKPAYEGQAVILKDSSGHESNYALSAAS